LATVRVESVVTVAQGSWGGASNVGLILRKGCHKLPNFRWGKGGEEGRGGEGEVSS